MAEPADAIGVLMVTGAYFPELSGAGLQCRELVRHLRDTVRVAVLTTTARRELPERDEIDGVRVHRVYVDPLRAWSKLTAGLRMARIVRRERKRFTILHLHGFSQKSMLLVVLALLLRKRIAIKLTSAGHDDPISMRARGRLTFWCYSRAQMYFGVSPRIQALYRASGLRPERFLLIPNGVDLERFRPADPAEKRALRREIGLPPEAAIVLFVGFFSQEKAPDVLFDAWSRVASADDGATVLVFVGATRSAYYEIDGRLADAIRQQASRLSLERRIFFVERTAEIEKYHRAADIFALTSVREGLPNALMEAMACASACVATRLEGVTDALIEDGVSGLLVPARDTGAVAAALTRLLSDGVAARAMGEAASRRIGRDFAMTAAAERHLVAYRALATP